MKGNTPFWRGRRVLVTGATGFLGGWLVRELLAREAEVTALIRRHRPDSQFFAAGLDRRVRIVEGEVADDHLLRRLLPEHDIQTIFHTAMAGGGVQATLASPIDCLQTTVESTWWLLEAIRRDRPDTAMVVCSSDKAYGAQDLPYREDQALRPIHPQEVAKASQDMLTQSFGRVYGLKVAVTRCGNFFGPYDYNFTRLIPYVARCCAEGTAPELRSNGLFARDFLHVRDAALAHLMLAERLEGDAALRGEVFNFSHEVNHTVAEIVARILHLAGARLQPVVLNSLSHEIPDMRLSCEKARRQLGWAPATEFDAGLAETVRWYVDTFRPAQREAETGRSASLVARLLCLLPPELILAADYAPMLA
jgi:CDP-glucose 4,6-dehydratase